MTDQLILLPDAEKVVVDYLLSRDEVTDYVEQRIFTELPGIRQGQTEWRFPAVRVTRIGGSPSLQTPRILDAPILQVEAWGGTKHTAGRIAETCAAALAVARFTEHTEAIVYGATFGDTVDLPDEAFSPAKPRYLFDVTLTIRPRSDAGS